MAKPLCLQQPISEANATGHWPLPVRDEPRGGPAYESEFLACRTVLRAYHASEMFAPEAQLSRRIWERRIEALRRALHS